MNAIGRLAKYIRERKLMKGIDIEEIHGVHTGDEREAVLRLSDIEFVLARLAAAEQNANQWSEVNSQLEAELRDFKEVQVSCALYAKEVGRAEAAEKKCASYDRAAEITRTEYERLDKERDELRATNTDLLTALQIVKEQRQVWWGKAVERNRTITELRAEVERWKGHADDAAKARDSGLETIFELRDEVGHHNRWAKDVAAALGCADAAKYRSDAIDCIRALKAKNERLAGEVEKLGREAYWSKVVFHDPDEGGRAVRHAWVEWAKTQPNPKPSWLVSYDDLSESDKEADRQIAQYLAQTLLRDLRIQLTAAQQSAKIEWFEGEPPFPWCDEWFIAMTTYGDKVVLTALSKEHSYDYKTADNTYIKADKIAKWAQFPDSEYTLYAQQSAKEQFGAFAERVVNLVEKVGFNHCSCVDREKCASCRIIDEIIEDVREAAKEGNK